MKNELDRDNLFDSKIKRTIMIVDDTEINRIVLSRLLSSSYKIIEASNGAYALDILKKEGNNISLILLDLVMPVMDGYTFLEKMKELKNINFIPVIVTTQKEEDEVKALEAGASDFIPKPYKTTVIKQRAESLIRLCETKMLVSEMKSDDILGLYNKKYFFHQIRRIMENLKENNFDIIACEIENFRTMNELGGESYGTYVLKCLSKLLLSEFEKDCICTRISENTFLIFQMHKNVYTNEYFENIVQILNRNKFKHNVTLKFGVLPAIEPEMTDSYIISASTLCIDDIRGIYGKYFAYFDENVLKRFNKEQVILENMEQAILQKQFTVYMQPKFDITGEKIIGAESLVRWNHPTLGFVSPADFIPLFEKNGFITKLDCFVWEDTCRIIKNWRRYNIGVPVSVNVSRMDIFNLNLVSTLKELVNQYNIAPSMLHLEITESAYTGDTEYMLEVMHNLKQEGFIIEMDDFGTGYSSLNMLAEMPLDILKIDQSFVRGKKSEKIEIMKFVIDLAKHMNLKTTAEGVETQEQLEILKKYGCDYIQGFLFSKPLAENEMLEKLKSQVKKDV